VFLWVSSTTQKFILHFHNFWGKEFALIQRTMWLIFGGDQKLINIPKIDILQFLLIVSEPERTNADI